MRLAALLLCVSVAACAQAPAVLENTGKPMRVALGCEDEQIAAAGLTCPPRQPCPVFLELADVEASGNRIFLAGNLHTDAATLASVLLATDDAGKTWHEPHERIRSAALDSVRFFDLEYGWISGHSLRAGIARDAFLLLTRDGGKIWRASPVGAEEGRAGTIESFEFESRSDGVLWIDRAGGAVEGNRWETYQTRTGGESWSLVEMTDKPPAIQREPRAPSGWRLRADGKVYRLEFQTAGRWQPVASFLIRVGECRESEPRFAEPPPPEPAPTPLPKPASP